MSKRIFDTRLSGDRENLKPQCPHRGLDLKGLALGLADDGAAKGRVVGDAQVHRIGLLGADDLVDVLIPGVKVLDADTAAQADVARLLIRFFNDNGVGQDILHLGDAAIELGLLVFRLVIFAVLREVAKGCLLYTSCEIGATTKPA